LLMALAEPAAAPVQAVDPEMARILEAVPEVLPKSSSATGLALPGPMMAWFRSLQTDRQRDVALVTLLSYSAPLDADHISDGVNWAAGLSYLAAQIVQNGNKPPARRALSPTAKAEREARAARALAWGRRIGLCDAVFVDTLRSLPPPATADHPDFRRAVHDLGMLAYTQGSCTDAAGVMLTH
jgi:hypothetical protein